MRLWQIGLVSVAAGIALPAVAQMNWGPQTRTEVEARVKERLGKFDTNNDGTVSRAEMNSYHEARMKERADERFAAMDADKNGSISKAEFEAAQVGDRGMGERIVRIERRGPEGAMAPLPPLPPASGAKPGERVRLMLRDRDDVTVMADGDGKGIVIADAVKKALERFDATDANKDGTLSPEERKAAREAWRVKMRSMTAPQPPKIG